ncbi:MAG: hypothetical protein GWN16_02685 [Calditrichae bacterium]|nr:hypothetical protein [Calditrichia bacterium]
MIELVNKETNRQYLLEPPDQSKGYKKAFYGANFEEYDTSGFDECFPTIAESPYPTEDESDQNYDLVLPDHGELWSQVWEYGINDNELVLRAKGIRLNYLFTKRITLDKNKIIIHYSLYNQSQTPFCYIWSAHPLLRVQPHSKILLSEDIDRVLLNWASDERLGSLGDVLDWPNLASPNGTVDYSVVQDRSLGVALKCFTSILEDGFAGIYFRESDETLMFKFDTKEVPYLGLWLCYGGWPVNSAEKHFTVGLEPCSGRPDSLQESVKRRECSEIEGETTKEWSLELGLWEGQVPATELKRNDSS